MAIAGLLVGKFYGLVWMDPLMGVIGGLVIARWAWSLLKGAGAVLLDAVPDDGLADGIRANSSVATTAWPTCISGAWARAILP